jgi:hypothetical protein
MGVSDVYGVAVPGGMPYRAAYINSVKPSRNCDGTGEDRCHPVHMAMPQPAGSRGQMILIGSEKM